MTAGGGKANTMALRMLRKSRHGPSGNGLDLQIRPVAELPVLQLDEDHAVVLPPAGKADAGNGHAGFHRLFFVLQEIALDLLR